ncbi:MAG: type IV secretory system conjugative DNA transfer family protein [Bryobacteraceae bacterium]
MFRRIVESRGFVSFVLSAAVWCILQFRMRFPEEHPILQLIFLYKPYLFHSIKWTYIVMQFTTPYIVFSTMFSLAYIFLLRQERKINYQRLPAYPPPAIRDRLFLVVGEIHNPKKPVPAETPHWLMIPERGLYTGVAIFGAVGSGKTSCCMYPFAEQLFAYRHNDPQRRAGGLILEVKGDFCYKVHGLLKKYNREGDYIEVGLASNFRYNPLHNDLEAYALAYGIASLLNNLFGKGKEPFWQQAYTNLVKFIILLHKVLYDYVTLFDVYACAINPNLLAAKIKEGEAMFRDEFLLLPQEVYLEKKTEELEAFRWSLDSTVGRVKARHTPELERYLNEHAMEHESYFVPKVGDGLLDRKQQQFEAVKRWFEDDWTRIENKLRTSIVEGISVFLSLFDDNPDVKRTFCPSKECYDPEKNKDGRYGTPLPPFAQLIEQGKVVCLNFPVAMNPGLAMVLGTLLKQDFQRAVLTRIPKIETSDGATPWRDIVFMCDEYQNFATCGQSDPSGDEKFFSLSRQARCIPIVATQSISSLRSTLQGESWRTLLQTFRTKIFLALSCEFSAKTASDMCGREEQLKVNYTFSETGQNAGVSVLTGRAAAHKATITTSKSYSAQMHPVFEAKIFSELKNAQSIVLAYDGLNPLPPSYCYLKPYYIDPNISYFEQLAQGLI